jgi:hypothetical protein
MASETLVSNHKTTRRNNPESNDFCFSAAKNLNFASGISLGRLNTQWIHSLEADGVFRILFRVLKIQVILNEDFRHLSAEQHNECHTESYTLHLLENKVLR